jgi:glycosyltransferase involved in cell wall biosynthesis
MRILHVHKYYHDHDGAGRYMLELMHGQDLAGHVTAPLAMHDPRNLPSAWEKYFVSALDTSKVRWGFGILKHLGRAWWSREAYLKTEAMLQAFRPDVVHVHNLYTHLSPSVLAACQRRNIPVVMSVHDYALVSANYALWDPQRLRSIEPQSGLWKVAKTKFIKGSFLATLVLDAMYRFQRRLGMFDRKIDVYLASSEFVKSALTAVGYVGAKIRVLPLFASVGTGFAEGEKTSPRPSIREGVLFAGRLEAYKGIDLYLKMVENFPDTSFYIAGTGPLEPEVQRVAAHYSNLHYLGFLGGQELWQKMATVELVIVPSRWAEPYGLVAVEAMACGTPVLVSDAGGLPEKIKNGVNGLVFKAGDVEDLKKVLKAALKDRKKLETMGEGARRYAKANASPAKHVAKVLEVYTDLVIHR